MNEYEVLFYRSLKAQGIDFDTINKIMETYQTLKKEGV